MKKITLLFMCLLFVGSGAIYAQVQQITGVITAADDGSPLPGASVLVVGTTRSVFADAQGGYTISAPANARLQFTYIGFQTQEVSVSGRSTINVALEADVQMLESVVVTGYGTIRKTSYTGSAEVIRSEVIERVQTSNVTKALEGVVPGVQTVGNTGQPGSGMTIRVRGIGSVYANNSPLYVVDGSPYNGNINEINPDDIESITVLKDALSAALYGARGANGVILITTKRGRGDIKLNFKATYGLTTRGIPEYDVMNPQEFYEATFTAMTNQYMTRPTNPMSRADAFALAAGTGAGSVLNALGMYNAYLIDSDKLFDPITGKVNTGGGLKYRETWEDELLKTAIRQEYQISASKGDAKSNYFASVSYVDEDGMVPQTSFSRLSARLNTSNQVRNWIKLELGIGATHQNTKNNQNDGSNAMNNPFSFLRNIPQIYPVYQYDMKTGQKLLNEEGKPLFDFGGSDGMSPGAIGRPYNPNNNMVALLPLDEYSGEFETLNSRIALEFAIVDGLTFRLQGSADIRNHYHLQWMNRTYGNGVGVEGRLYRNQNKYMTATIQQLLNYTKSFNKHNINATFVHESYARNSQHLETHKTGFPFDTREHSLGTVLQGITSYHDNDRIEGYALTGDYDYEGKYFIGGSFRRDGSSRFAPENRWGNFWSIGGSWHIHRESFMNSVGFVNFLKLRVSYGAQGNFPTGFYPWMGNYSLSYKNGNLPGAFHTSLDVRELKWESQRMFNVGLDFVLFKGLSGSVEYYIRDNDDMLFQRPLPPSTGITTKWQNI
ncbi:MAG: SusC/RagA family TonB-linked outer membrane protein, partial [Bacteroidales bacterium]|nr:SusC/RagA family TonB-linked outer membrane protein [Bacteroidales bacterium]